MNQNYSFKLNAHFPAKLVHPQLHSVYLVMPNQYLPQICFIITNVNQLVLQLIMTIIKFVQLAAVNAWSVIQVDVVNVVINIK